MNSSTPICHHNGQNQATRYDVMTISFHGQEDDFDTEAPAPDPETSRDITLPPTNDTLSIIDDMELFDDQMNSNNVAVTVTL